MKNFHWGYRIALVYALFVAAFVTLFVVSLQFKNELVTPDYYAEELKFQDKIEQMNRTNALVEQPVWNIEEQHITIKFPEELKTQVHNLKVELYRPSDSSKDKTYAFTGIDSNGKIELDKRDFINGRYRLQLSWNMNQLEYYKEGVVYL